MYSKLVCSIIACLGISCSLSCNDSGQSAQIPVPATEGPAIQPINYVVVKTLPHDLHSFTEGLFVHEGKLYESTGSPDELPDTRSEIGVLDTTTGKLQVKVQLDRNKHFGEGSVILNNKLYQLTYRTSTCFVYDATTYKPAGQFRFANKEGWGLTTDGTSLIMSDGTNVLTWMDPQTFNPIKTVMVSDERGQVMLINELEYIKGFIYANIYTKDEIIRIDPATGKVTGRIDLSSLARQVRAKDNGAMELNGIAWDAASDRIYITGKMWGAIYEISFPH